jgi:uncharacterized protein YggE
MDVQSTQGRGGFWKILSTLGVLLIVLVALVIVQQGYNFSQAVKGKRPDNTISVSATGKVKAVPDVAVISLGVITQGSTAKAAQDEAATKINKINDFVKSLGVKKEDITTSQASVNPRYDYQNGANKIIGFDSNQMVTVKVRGVDKGSDVANKILAGAVDNGANQIYGSQFTIDEPDNLKQAARKDAIAKAKQKAQELAQAAGIKLGKVVSVQDGENSVPPMYPMAYADKAVGMGGGGSEAIAQNLEPGSQEVMQTITLVFEVK